MKGVNVLKISGNNNINKKITKFQNNLKKKITTNPIPLNGQGEIDSY